MADYSRDDIARNIREVLAEVQELSGREVPEVTDECRPIGDLAGFDSLMGVEVTLLLSQRLGVELPGSPNFFISEDGTKALRVGEIARRIYNLVG